MGRNTYITKARIIGMRVLWGAGLALVLLVLFVPRPAYACDTPVHASQFPPMACGLLGLGIGIGSAPQAVGEAVGGVFGHFVAAIAAAFALLLEIAVRFFTAVLIDVNKHVGFYDNSFVRTGWVATRDIANWFFIVILIAISLGTILGLEEYNARRLLPKLIIVALLINFSLFITGLVVNVAQLFMVFFVNSLGGYNAFSQGLLTAGIGEQYALGGGAGITGNLFRIIFYAMAAFVFVYLGILLIIRIVMLWLSMILAPIAFLSSILPATSGFFNDWMKKFLDWSIFGVFAAFFVWLSTYLMDYMVTVQKATSNIQLTGSGNAPDVFRNLGLILQYITILAFLLAAIRISKDMAGRAANLASGAMAVGAGAALGLAAAGPGAIAGIRARAAVRTGAPPPRGVGGRIRNVLGYAGAAMGGQMRRNPVTRKMERVGGAVPTGRRVGKAGKQYMARVNNWMLDLASGEIGMPPAPEKQMKSIQQQLAQMQQQQGQQAPPQQAQAQPQAAQQQGQPQQQLIGRTGNPPTGTPPSWAEGDEPLGVPPVPHPGSFERYDPATGQWISALQWTP